MRGAASAIGWEFGRHHRLGLLVLGLYFAAFLAIKGWVLGPDVPIGIVPPNGLGGFVVAPLMIAWLFFVGVFTYGLSGDLGARESIFPKRMFTLPVGNLALAGWPMLYGTAASATPWLAALLIVRWSGGGTDLPWIWPALLGAAFLAWMQALTWLSYPLRGMRTVVAVVLLTCIDAVVILAIYFRASEPTMIAILAPQLPLAFLVAWYAVSRARQGAIPDWHFLDRIGSRARRQDKHAFRSATHAQAWIEWRRHGWTLPLLVAIVVPCVLLLLFIPGHDNAPIVFAILFFALIAPPMMAALAAPALSTFTTYAATRPMSSAALVAAKLRMTMWSAAAAWVLALVFIVAALLLSGRMDVVVERMHAFAEVSGATRATAVVLLVLAALVASTWKNLVMSLAIGLTNRPWIIKSSVLVVMILLTAAFPFAYTVVFNDKVQGFVWDYLPWILAGLVLLKTLAGSWVAIRLHDEGVLSDRALVTGAVCWLAAVAAAYGLLAWLAASPIFPFYFLAALAVLAVPWVRLGAAPLALALSRHR